MSKSGRILIIEALKKIGEEITIAGSVATKRDHGKITFIDLRDKSGLIQIVGSGEDFSSLKPEDVVEITGLIKERPEGLVNPKLETGKK